jgi:hypothetical protein
LKNGGCADQGNDLAARNLEVDREQRLEISIAAA